MGIIISHSQRWVAVQIIATNNIWEEADVFKGNTCGSLLAKDCGLPSFGNRLPQDTQNIFMYYVLSNFVIILQTKIAKLILIKPKPPHRYTQIDGVSKKSYEVISKKVYRCVSFLVVSTDFTLHFFAKVVCKPYIQ